MSVFLSSSQEQLIIDAIATAEHKTSGEIKVHVESTCNIDPLLRAQQVFESLKLQETEKRNAVLVYVAFESKRFAILGDKGINQVVPVNFWDEIANEMRRLLKESKPADAITHAVQQCGEKLKHFFPIEANDTNELSNDISFGN